MLYLLCVLLLSLILSVEAAHINQRNAVTCVAAAFDPSMKTGNNDGNTGKIQYMVTQRMRRVLEDDLGYLSREIDVIEPQIAAVVIERRLSRPANGMPSSWRRPDASSGGVNAARNMNTLGKRIKDLSKVVLSLATKVLPVVLPLAFGLCVIPDLLKSIQIYSNELAARNTKKSVAAAAIVEKKVSRPATVAPIVEKKVSRPATATAAANISPSDRVRINYQSMEAVQHKVGFSIFSAWKRNSKGSKK